METKSVLADTAAVAALSRKSTSTVNQEIGQRLIRLRSVMDMGSQLAFTKFVEIAAPTWNQYEKGHRRPSLDEAFKIVRRTGVTLDWIYFGEEAGLPHRLATALQSANYEPDLLKRRSDKR